MHEKEIREKMRIAILSELLARKKEAKDKGKKFDFNNLIGKLPHGSTRNAIEMARMQDQPMHNREREYDSEVSELSFSTSWKNFFIQVDQVIERLEKEGKINLKQIEGWEQTIKRGGEFDEIGEVQLSSSQAEQKITDMLQILYVELRLLGYSHYDLWQ